MMKNESSFAWERNKDSILQVLREVITNDNKRVLEIGSGSAQHAVYFAKNLKDIVWTTSDIISTHEQIKTVLNNAKLSNLRGPLAFEVGKDNFPKYNYDIVFTANTFHIMSWKQCKNLMKILGNRLREGSQVIIYGPFNYEGKFTSDSNYLFDQELKQQDPLRGIRSFEDINKNMKKNGFELFKDYEMPANNRMLVFTRLVFMNSL
jgi:cyclopropane fatty-acyl-phospholipid synthase-like methyltransferase